MFLFRTVFYLLIQNKVNSYTSMSGKGRKPVKKILAYAARLLTMRVEVQSPYNRIIISYNREGRRSAFAVFLYRNIPQGLFLICGVVLRRSILDFYSSNYLTRTSAAAGKPTTRPIWTSFLFLFKAVCLKSCESKIHGFLSG